MSIWLHADSSIDIERVKSVSSISSCPFCSEKLTELQNRVHKTKPEDRASLTGSQRRVFACQVCGWWKLGYTSTSSNAWSLTSTSYASLATLKKLDIADVSAPIDEVQTYLAAKYESRGNVHPYTLEEVVARVFAQVGYESRVTAYTKDGGIDVILDGVNESLIGVQVKRYRDKIRVHQIREFLGALMLKGMTQGIFVTTSEFTQDSRRAANKAATNGIALELVDSAAFFDALSISQREQFRDKQELLESIGEPKLFEVDSQFISKPSNP